MDGSSTMGVSGGTISGIIVGVLVVVFFVVLTVALLRRRRQQRQQKAALRYGSFLYHLSFVMTFDSNTLY